MSHMNILRRLTTPTGDILIVQGEYGNLECLSLGDYGAEVNLSDKPVSHGPLMSLYDKWVITISTQYGCSMGCEFCDVPLVGIGRNCTAIDLMNQVIKAIHIHPEIDISTCKRLNLHYARMGEPTFNPAVILATETLHDVFGRVLHPVVSTMMPGTNRNLLKFLEQWMLCKNVMFDGNAGLQLSINSTNEVIRRRMFNNNAMELYAISHMFNRCLPRPKGRKITLNFAVSDDYAVDAYLLAELFPPEFFICKLTPMHVTQRATENRVTSKTDATKPEAYQKLARELREVGFDVLVFIASDEEDRGRITCGNAILSGSTPLLGTPVYKEKR